MEQKKYIHYCWFGDKKLSKLEKKCIKSWKRYLPDYEIILWNEKNTNLDDCPFLKEAYNSKKFAFVADYVRTKAIFEMGGIYFDTDMLITKDISELLKNDSFLGVENSGYIACGVWYESKSKSNLAKYLLDYYKNQKYFNLDKMYSFSIPKLITNYLVEYGFDFCSSETQILKNGMVIYSREYFYPLSYGRGNNIFTSDTYMIHYAASRLPKSDKRYIQLIRKFGLERANKFLERESFFKRNIKRFFKFIGFPFYKIYRKRIDKKQLLQKHKDFLNDINRFKGKDVLAICNKNWLGTKHATKELFDNVFEFYELTDKDNIPYYAEKISSLNLRLIIFSAFSNGWSELIREIKRIDKNVTIKVLWHGSNAMHLQYYDWNAFKEIFKLLKENYIASIGFAKKSMYELYKELGYNVEFIMNTVHIKTLPEVRNTKNSNLRIGLYTSGNRWEKNFYNQFAGASLVKNATIDVISLNMQIREFSSLLKSKVVGVENDIPHDDMLIRLAQNDINLNCSFVECAPITPLESFEVGVPCLTGDNHHYWENSELEKYLVIGKCDNSFEIYKRILYCLENKELIMKLYREWKVEYDKKCEENNKKFLITN